MNKEGTEAVYPGKELPPCDFCGAPACYDAKSKQGPWFYGCEADFATYGIGLGVGLGQRLVTA
jgi:hypothetical protein